MRGAARSEAPIHSYNSSFAPRFAPLLALTSLSPSIGKYSFPLSSVINLSFAFPTALSTNGLPSASRYAPTPHEILRGDGSAANSLFRAKTVSRGRGGMEGKDIVGLSEGAWE